MPDPSTARTAGPAPDATGPLDAYRRRRRAVFYPKTDSPLGDDLLRSLRDGGGAAIGPADAAAACRSALGEAPAAVAPLAEPGTFHRLYRATMPGGHSVVVRLDAVNGPDRDYGLLADLWADRRLRPLGLPAPAVHAVDLSRRAVPYDFEVLDEAPGRSLRDYDEDDRAIRPLLTALGRLAARLHRVEASGAGWLDAAAMLGSGADPARIGGLFGTWREYVSSAAPQSRRRLRRDRCDHVCGRDPDRGPLPRVDRPARTTPTRRVMHGDLGNHNVFVRDGEVSALIDWEDCLVGDPVFEVAFWATFHPERRHDAFLEGYAAEAPLPADFERRFWLYFLRIALSKTVHRHRFGYVDRPGRPPAAARIRRALEALES